MPSSKNGIIILISPICSGAPLTDMSLLLANVLSRALQHTYEELGNQPAGAAGSVIMGSAWPRGLRLAFADHYNPENKSDNIAVFGGRPLNPLAGKNGVPSGIKEWRSWEFMDDVAVLRIRHLPAAYKSGKNVYMASSAI